MKKIMSVWIACLLYVFPLCAAEAEKSPYELSAEALDESLGVDVDAPKPEDFVRAVYFYRVPSCDNCKKMSKTIFEIVKTRFADETKNKTLVLRYMNYEDPKYAKIVEAFDVKIPILVIVEVKGGKDARGKKAERIWELFADEENLNAYIAEELNAWLTPREEEK